MSYFKEEVEIKERMHEAMHNSYKVIIEDTCPYSLIENEGDVVFAHNIENPITLNHLVYMISYWEDLEEYEKCHELKKFHDEIKRISEKDMRSSEWLSQIP